MRLFSAVALSLAAGIASTALSQESRIVELHGRRVEVIRTGTGSPALILESGGAESASEWTPVMKDLGRLTTVIAYSRAGHGKSSAPSAPVTPQSSVRELHELLAAIGETGPIIIAGHSWGGLLARLYVSMFPENVRGVVLVDGTHESQFARWEPLEPGFSFAEAVAALLPQMPPAARIDYPQFLAVEKDQRVDGMKPLPPGMPIAVITAMKPCPPEREFTCRDPRALAIWRELHNEWFNQATIGIHIVSAETGHYVMVDQPALITQAVSFVLRQARESAAKATK